jgi:hypothetical protein
MRVVLLTLLASSLAGRLTAQDSGFAAMQARGKMAMGVDQYSSWHHFEPLADGGRIMLQRDAADTAGTTAIREHLKDIAMRFRAGDFAIPGFVHAQQVPGTRVLAAKRAAIRYVFHPLPGGGEVRIVTKDAAAVAAVHQFLAFQRSEHHVGQHSH